MSVEIFIKRPVLSTVISIMTVILGLIGLVSLPIEQYPDIAPPTIFVRAQYPGASAETVQKSVLAPLEEAINGVEGMTYMTSSASNQGSASITVYFEQGYNGDMAQVNVQNHVSQAFALLPSEVTQGGVSVQKRQTSTLLIVGVTSTEGQYDEKFLNNYADINIIPAIKRVKGVGDCDAMGLKSYTMRLWLDPAKMKEQNLIPSDIAGVLAEQNIEGAPGSFGELSENQYEYSMRYTGRLTTPEEFGDMIIRADAAGNVLRVKDVARVEMGQLYYTINTILNNKPAFMMMISQMVGSNATDVVKRTKATLADLEKNFPPGLKIEYMQDVTLFLNASIHEVVKTLFEAFFLVFLVVLIFLQDWRSTLIPLIAVPVSLIGTFFVLNLIGFSLNLLTLSALVLAIAIVVDDAIVVVEAVHAKLDMGYKSARQASIDAMNEISGAIVSITLVMASVFIPVSFIGGTAGTFYQQFGITLAISIVLSAVNALTLSPALCSIFLKPKDEHGNEMKMGVLDKFYSNFNASYNAMLEKYKKVVRFFIDRKSLTVIVLIIGIAALGITSQFTKTGLIPNEDTGTLFVTIATPPGTSLTETKKVAMQVDEMIGNNPAVDARLCIAGYSFIGGMGTNMATFIIRLKDFADRSVTESSNMVLGMIYKQTGAIKGSQILAFQPPMVTGFSLTNGITFTMQDRTGGDIMKFFETTQKFLAELNKRPEISNAMTMFNPTYPQYLVEVNNAKCKQNGISPKTVISTMQGYFGGMYSSNFNSYGKL
ncbi:MAG: efflux RND transporter permease subunit, partial [Bacteroidaceae bacterium]|nr:efflux RND transporter permease subunit [Bacteroidaceae bacterium]